MSQDEALYLLTRAGPVRLGASGAESMAQVVVDVWEQVLRESPAMDWLTFFDDRLTYREQLDRRRRNAYGDIIPQITLVRRNLRLLGKPCRPPRLPL